MSFQPWMIALVSAILITGSYWLVHKLRAAEKDLPSTRQYSTLFALSFLSVLGVVTFQQSRFSSKEIVTNITKTSTNQKGGGISLQENVIHTGHPSF